MRMFILTSFGLVCFRLLFLTVLTASTAQSMSNPIQDNGVCERVNCFQGKCQPSNNELGFNCNCYPGWKKLSQSGIELPLCLLPNCSVDLNCGNGSASPPSPSPPPLLEAFSRPQFLNLPDPCVFILCEDGKCVKNGIDFTCRCNKGSKNLFDDPRLPCHNNCSLGGDCDGLFAGWLNGSPEPAITYQSPPSFESPPIQDSPSLPPASSGSPGSGSDEKMNCSRKFLLMILMTTIISLIDYQYLAIKTYFFFF